MLEIYLYRVSIVVIIVLLSTVLQKHHYIIINKISILSWKYFKLISSFFIRLWVILHEFSHILFAFLFWHKIKNVDFFLSNWWSVQLEIKDYISSIWYFKWSWFTFFILLIFNRLWIFFTSTWPLIFWTLFTFLLVNYSFWMPLFSINMNISDYNINEITLINLIILFVYWTFLAQWFILSWQDIKNLYLYRWYNIISTFFWSFINLFFLIFFLFIISFFYFYLIFFFIFYLIWFIFLLILYFLFYIFKKYF